MKITRSRRVFTFNVDAVREPVNENKIKTLYSHYINMLPLRLSFSIKWKYIFIFHIITKEHGQHVRSDLAFASQNLKFPGQMSDDRGSFAGLRMVGSLPPVTFHFTHCLCLWMNILQHATAIRREQSEMLMVRWYVMRLVDNVNANNLWLVRNVTAVHRDRLASDKTAAVVSRTLTQALGNKETIQWNEKSERLPHQETL